jgi:hypothetical protein
MPKGGPAALVGAGRMGIGRSGEPVDTTRKGREQDQTHAGCAVEEMTADMLRVTADLNDRDDTAINEPLQGRKPRGPRTDAARRARRVLGR